jgi:hypothetical protein
VRCLARDDGVAGDAAGTLVSLVAPVDEPG